MDQKTMHTRYITCFRLNSGFRSLLISSLLAVVLSCQGIFSDEIKNPGFVMNEHEPVPEFWALEGYEELVLKEEFEKGRYKPLLTGGDSAVVLFQKITLPDSGSYFVIGKFRADIDTGSFFVEAKGASVHKRIEYTRSKEVCKRTLFSIHINDSENVTLRIGLGARTLGSAYPDTLFVYKEKYFEKEAPNLDEMKSEIASIIGVSSFDAGTFDQNVETIGASVNASLLRNPNQKGQAIASLYASDLFKSEQTSYLHRYMTVDKSRNAYCQKSSLSLDEILKLYKIPVRQIHWQVNCSGIHQFTEYWNPYDKRWKLIDLYYGIRYVDEKGNYLGFEEVEKLVRENKFSLDNVIKREMGRLYFKEDEIMDGWQNTDLAVRIIRK